MSELTQICHLKDYPKRLLQHVTVANRIEALLEDMNLEPISMDTEFHLGSIGRRTEIFHASMVGSQSGKSICNTYPMGCGRELYYSLLGKKAIGSWEPRTRRILDTGTAIHAQLQAYLAEICERSEGTESFTPEADINPDKNEVADRMDISGHTDGIYTVREGDDVVRFGIEIKSINDAGYKKTTGPHPAHIMQGTIYQKCLDLPVMLFIYYNKNDSSIAEFAQIFDANRWYVIEDKLNLIRELMLNNEIPAQEVSFQCKRCNYKRICEPPMRNRRSEVSAQFRKRA